MATDMLSTASGRVRRFFWMSQTAVFRQAAPPVIPHEVCGMIDARASLRRVRAGERRRVKLTVKPAALEAAVEKLIAHR